MVFKFTNNNFCPFITFRPNAGNVPFGCYGVSKNSELLDELICPTSIDVTITELKTWI